MWNEILEYLSRHSAQKLIWRTVLTEGALAVALMATASWLSR
jgi:hypothetical protein